MKIGVFCGGVSSEREVSLKSGETVYQALIRKGYDAFMIDVDRNITEVLKKEKIEFAFIALHGKYGEDGTIQGLLEIAEIPYTGSGVLASGLTINKIMSKKIFVAEGIPTAKFITVNRNDYIDIQAIAEHIKRQLPVPVVLKAPEQGSTIGIEFVFDEKDLVVSLEKVFKYDSQILVEQYIKGTEITAAVLGNENPKVLPLIEIVSKTGLYDYVAKYTPGLSEHIIPARISKKLQEEIKDIALKTYKAIGCKGYARVDFMIDEKENKPYVLEINTVPGMTATSLFPDAAMTAGIGFDELVEKILKLGLENHKKIKKVIV